VGDEKEDINEESVDCIDDDEGDEGEDVDDVDDEDVDDEDVEGVNVCVGPLLGVAITKLPLESVAVKPKGFVYKLLLLEDCVNITFEEPLV
jgi:hypothetical protein